MSCGRWHGVAPDSDAERSFAEPHRWLDLFTSSAELFPPTLLHSLINVVCSYDPVGWGVPYNHVLFSDYAEPLADAAAQVLCIVLDHRRAGTANEPQGCAALIVYADGVNVAHSYVSAISRKEDFQFIFSQMERLLGTPFVASNVYLPYSTKRTEAHQEMVMLFWKLVTGNPSFLSHVLKHEDVCKIVVPAVYFILDGRKDDGTRPCGVCDCALTLVLQRNSGWCTYVHFCCWC